jgi:hypothetical protein
MPTAWNSSSVVDFSDYYVSVTSQYLVWCRSCAEGTTGTVPLRRFFWIGSYQGQVTVAFTPPEEPTFLECAVLGYKSDVSHKGGTW